eukprot:COSAG03_NODE_763_length_5959_cov_1295.360922_6_plen_74_part_00
MWLLASSLALQGAEKDPGVTVRAARTTRINCSRSLSDWHAPATAGGRFAEVTGGEFPMSPGRFISRIRNCTGG